MKKCYCLSLLLLTGCLRVGPDFTAPETVIETEWTQEGPFYETDEDLGAWWENFNDETLNQLIDIALSDNYTLEAVANRIIAARANLGFAIGEWFPQTQQAEGSSLRTHISANAPNTLNASRDFIDNIIGIRIAWELDFWGRFRRGIEVAYGEYAATEEDYQDVRRLLIGDLVSFYVQQKTFQRRIETLDRNIAIQYRSVEIANVRWREGYESELDYAQAVTLWRETIAQKATLETGLKRVTTALAVLTGMTPEQFLCAFPLTNSSLNTPTEAVINFPAEILCNRPDLRRSLDLLYSQSARVGVAISELYPRISFTGFLGLDCAADTRSTANQKGKHLFSRSSLTFFYGPDFSWPILDYGRLENRVREQYAFLDEGIANYRNQVLEVYKEVEDALTFFVNSINETENLKESFKHAKRAVDISTLQYQEGLADYSRVLNSLQLQVTAEDNLAQAEGNIGLAYATIYKSLGSY